MDIPVIIIGCVILMIIAFIWVTYNVFVKLNTRIDEAWADIGAQLKRRNDLFGNLVAAVKGYTKHESAILKDFARAREAVAKAVKTGSLHDVAESETSFGQAVQGMRMITEQYPDLKADKNFLQLQSTIEDTEDKIQAARRFYNAGVKELNIKVKLFPNNIIAGIFHFAARDFWDTKDHVVLDKGLDAAHSKVEF
jgi:LemA protein